MEIRSARIEDLDNLYEFNDRMYPEKRGCRKIIDYWFSKSKDEINNTQIMLDGDRIVGQCFFIGMSYFLNGQSQNSVWGFDLIVEEEQRKTGLGADLMLHCLDKFPQYAATGVGPSAMPLHRKLGRRELGKLRKYVGLCHPEFLLHGLLKHPVDISSFPETVSIPSGPSFEIVSSPSDLDLTCPFNTDLMEIGRDADFIRWRFWGGLHQYAVYKKTTSQDYFVVRPISKKHVLALVLVDYRCRADENGSFHEILKAVKVIASKMRIPVLICGSSLQAFDAVLEDYKFRSVGYERPIIGKVKLGDRKESVENRKFIFVTLADSDGEVSW